MSFHTTRPACTCCGTAVLAQTAQQLCAQGGIPVGLCLEELALFGTCLDDAVILTSNPHSMVEGRGGYAAFQPVGQRLRLNPRRPAMRMASAREMLIMLSPAGPDGPAALSVVAPDGRIQHRIQVSGEDWHRLGTLPQAAAHISPPADAPQQAAFNVIRLDDIRNRRANWCGLPVGAVIDDVLADAGRSRFRCLPHIGAGARRAKAEVLPSFLAFLCDRQVELAISIFADAMVQTLFGTCVQMLRIGDFSVCETDGGRFSLSRTGVSQAWVCRHGPSAQLELYDGSGTCFAMLHAAPGGDWADYLEAYPTL